MNCRDVRPGDVLVVYDSTFPGWLIRLGEWLAGDPHRWNHMLVISHRDAGGTLWAIEARPSGVGWTAGRDLTRYLTSRKTIDNALQRKTDEQRAQVVEVARGLFGTPYDWTGIVLGAMNVIDAQSLWLKTATAALPDTPAHLVCSSLVSYVYSRVGLARPVGAYRMTTPGRWARFILDRHYDSRRG